MAVLLCLGVETFGRASPQAVALLRALARWRASAATPALREGVRQAVLARWRALLSVAVQRAVAEAVLREAGTDLLAAEAALGAPPLDELLDYHRV